MYKRQVQYSTAQHSTAQHSTAQHSTAQHSTAQHSTAQHSTALHCTAQHSTALHCTALHSTAQHSTAQHAVQYCKEGKGCCKDRTQYCRPSANRHNTQSRVFRIQDDVIMLVLHRTERLGSTRNNNSCKNKNKNKGHSIDATLARWPHCKASAGYTLV